MVAPVIPARSAPVSTATAPPGAGMNYARLYDYRFRGVDQAGRQAVWREIAQYVHVKMDKPKCVLDPAAGRGEFITAVPAAERWAVDLVRQADIEASGARMITADIREAELPDGFFDGVFLSNFLEHLPSPDTVAAVLGKLRGAMSPGARIAVMGPNFRYCSREYFDCADHSVILTHVSMAEHLHAAGFEVERCVPRFLPYSFRGLLPQSSRLTRAYLRTPPLWRLLGKQFFLVARK
jgi:Methyltransferase domain